MKFHPLATGHPLPARFNNLFDYEPDSLCRAAAEKLQRELPLDPPEGKMYGILIVEREGQTGYLQAYSGQIDKEGDDFVPAVFDYLQPGGYFKIHEEEITRLNNRIAQMETSSAYSGAKEKLKTVRMEAENAVEEVRKIVQGAKFLRDRRRREAFISEEEHNEMIRQSQFLKAELHRTKTACARRIAEAQTELDTCQEKITAWKRERKLKSDRLQRWLFSQFSLLNAKGECKNLTDMLRTETAAVRLPARLQTRQYGDVLVGAAAESGNKTAWKLLSGLQRKMQAHPDMDAARAGCCTCPSQGSRT